MMVAIVESDATKATSPTGRSGPPRLAGPCIAALAALGCGAPQSAPQAGPALSANQAELAFQAGGHQAGQVPFDVCVGDVTLEDPQFTPRPDAPRAPIPNVLVNQVGYLPGLDKIAIVKSDATSPLKWELLDKSAKVVASGETTVHGPDAASGDRLHAADFSSYTRSGTGYTLRVLREGGGKQDTSDVSHPFDIGAHVYNKLKFDSLHYFYHTRSGIPIVLPYAGDPKWTRPAGHLADRSAGCAPDAHCDYSLDASGGWYDAGDHGKYVVNGGITSWTLMNEYERAKYLGTSVDDFGDGKMSIPENHNGAPDLLDEVRWELDFMMRMQVPEGRPLAGMVHHKIHDKEWTALATRPDQDAIPRLLRPLSTAATLNVAAAAAQGARIWKAIDPGFATRCLQAAERAWSAAVAHPTMYITGADTVGGGPYDDADVSDEFFWAASELFITTKKDAYRDFLLGSPHHGSVPIAAAEGGDAMAISWQKVAPLGTISIAVVSTGLPANEVGAARAAIVHAADAFVGIDHDEGYRFGFEPDSSGQYPWGSNSSILNHALVMALAYDFTKNPKYLNG
jgi:endoglucanase